MKNVILFHPKQGFFFAAMDQGQRHRWRQHKGFVVFSWKLSNPKEDDVVAFLQYLSIHLLWSGDWARIVNNFSRVHKGSRFRRQLRAVSKYLQKGETFEKTLRMLLPTSVAMAILSAQKRGQLPDQMEKIVEDYRDKAAQRSKRKARQLYPTTLMFGLVGLIAVVDVQFIPVLKSLFESYGIAPPLVMNIFNIGFQLGLLVLIFVTLIIVKVGFRFLSFSRQAAVPVLGELLTITLHQHLVDAFLEAQIRECSYDTVLQERVEAEPNVFLKFGFSTVAGRLQQGYSLSNAFKEIPPVRGWVGGWVGFVVGAPGERAQRGLFAYRKQLQKQESVLRDRLLTLLVSLLVIIVAVVIALLSYLITLPLQYADKLI
jgi:type II secretory pathway component PulF